MNRLLFVCAAVFAVVLAAHAVVLHHWVRLAEDMKVSA